MPIDGTSRGAGSPKPAGNLACGSPTWRSPPDTTAPPPVRSAPPPSGSPASNRLRLTGVCPAMASRLWRPARQCRAGLAGPDLVPARGPPEAQHVIGAAQGILQVPIREDVIGSGPPPARPPKPGPRSTQPCRPARRCRATAFSPSSSASSCADPDSMSSDPRWDEYTICTAVAPDAVFTVRNIRHQATLRPRLSAQTCSPSARNPQVRATYQSKILDREPSQVDRMRGAARHADKGGGSGPGGGRAYASAAKLGRR